MKEAIETWGLIVGLLGVVAAAAWKTVRMLWRLGRMVDAFLGYDDHPSMPDRLESVETEAKATKDEVLALSTEVSELREQVAALSRGAQQSAEAAATSAELARQTASRTEGLLRRHMENGVEIMAVGVHNDGVSAHNHERMIAGIENLGGEVTDLRNDYRDYPPVDTGE